MSNVINEKMKSAEIADKLGIETVTLRKYCLVLESNGYIVQRNGKNREFTSDDLEVLAQMKYLIEKIGMDREQAAKIIISKIKTNMNDTENSLPSESVTLANPNNINILQRFERYEERQNDIYRNVHQFAEMMHSFQQQAVTQEKKRLVEQRQLMLDTQFTIRRIENLLRNEALKFWQQEPEEKRLIKRFLRKPLENKEARDEFIKDYIDKHLESRLKAAIID